MEVGSHTTDIPRQNLHALLAHGREWGIVITSDDMARLQSVADLDATIHGGSPPDGLVRHREVYRRRRASRGGLCAYMISTAKLALQRVRVSIRGCLCVLYDDVDMKDAHPVCVVSFFPSRTPLLTIYVENRQEWLEAVRQLHRPRRWTTERNSLEQPSIE